MGREDSADLAMADHRRRLLDHGELAIDEADAMHHAGPGGKRHQLPRLLRRHTQRFFGEDVQPGGEDLPVNLGMQMVRRTVMHHLQPRMGQQRLHAVVGMGNIQRSRLALRRLKAAVAQRHHLDIPQPPQRLQMRRANKPSPNNRNLNHVIPSHRRQSHRRPVRQRE